MSDPLSARVAKLEKAIGKIRYLFASSRLPGDLEAKERQAEKIRAAGGRVVLVVIERVFLNPDGTPCRVDP